MPQLVMIVSKYQKDFATIVPFFKPGGQKVLVLFLKLVP
jgi:hypothetical protein